MRGEILSIFDYQPSRRPRSGPEPSVENPAQVFDFVGPFKIRREDVMIERCKCIPETAE